MSSLKDILEDEKIDKIDKPWDFEEIADACQKALKFAYNLRRKNVGADIPWSGPTYRHSNFRAPDEALKAENLEYVEEDQGRDALTEIIAVILQLGIEQGRRITMTTPPVTTMRFKIESARIMLRE